MKSNELRIGNYTDCFGICEVIGTSLKKIKVRRRTNKGNYLTEKVPLNSLELKKIELTEQWLLDFGFEVKDKRQNRFINDDDFELEFQGNKVAYCIWNEEYPSLTNFIGHCYYVHQLQNLYFALTGRELK